VVQVRFVVGPLYTHKNALRTESAGPEFEMSRPAGGRAAATLSSLFAGIFQKEGMRGFRPNSCGFRLG